MNINISAERALLDPTLQIRPKQSSKLQNAHQDRQRKPSWEEWELLRFTVPALEKRSDEEPMFGWWEWLHVWRKTCSSEADEGRAALCLLDVFERSLTESKHGENPVLHKIPLRIWCPSGIQPAEGTFDDVVWKEKNTLFKSFSKEETRYSIT